MSVKKKAKKGSIHPWRVFMTPPPLLFRSTLSQCCHAAVALLYPFVWQHTYIPVLPPAMLDIVCTPTPFIVGLLSSSLSHLSELPLEEVRGAETPPLRGSEVFHAADGPRCPPAGSRRGSGKQPPPQTGKRRSQVRRRPVHASR